MNASRTFLPLVLALLAPAAWGAAQDEGKKADAAAAPPPAEIRLEPREIENIAKLLAGIEKARAQASLRGMKQEKKLAKKLEELFAKLREEKREPLEAIRSWWKIFSSEKYVRFRGRTGRQSNKRWVFRWMGKEYPVIYQLLVPSTVRAHTAAGLVLCLHPKQGKMDGREYLRHMYSTKALTSGPLILAPELPDDPPDATWSGRKFLYATFGLLGGEIFQSYNVDRNRVFLDGYADGAAEAWRLASGFADNFAGVIIRGAMPPEGTRFEDFINTAFLLVGVPGMDLDPAKADEVAEKMRKAGVKVTVLKLAEAPRPRRERDAFKAITDPLVAFLGKTTRNPYPERVDWSVKSNNTRRSFWIKSEAELEGEVVSAEARKKPPSFQATIERRKNRVVIKTHRILKLLVELNDLLLDLDRPVTFEVNGKVLFHGQPRRELNAVLESFYKSGDWTRIYPWSREIEVPAEEKGGGEKKGPSAKSEPEGDGAGPSRKKGR